MFVTKISAFTFLFIILILVSGCQTFSNHAKINNLLPSEKKVLKELHPELSDRIDKGKAQMGSPPPFTYNPVEVVESPNTTLVVSKSRCFSGIILPPFVSGKMTLGELITYLRTRGIKVETIDFPQVNLNYQKTVVLHFPEGASLCDVVREIAQQTEYYAQVISGDTLIISSLMRLIFRLPVPTGSFDISANLASSQESQTGGSMNIAANAGENVDFRGELEEKLKVLLGQDGFFVFDKATGLLEVFCTRDKEALVKDFVKRWAQEVSRTARVYISVLQINSSGERERELEWAFALRRALIEKPWKYGLTNKYFDITTRSSPPTISEQSYQIGAASIEAPERHRFFIHLLSRMADVSILENTYVTIISGQAAVISSGRIREYIKEVSRSVVSDVGEVSYEVNKDKIHSGIKLYLSGTIRGDSLSLAIMVELQELVDLQTVNFRDYMVQNPTLDERRYATVLQLLNNQTTAIVGVVRNSSKKDKTGIGFEPLDFLIGRRTNQKNQSYLVILLTPQIIPSERGGLIEVLK